MAKAIHWQSNFNGGELSPLMAGRTDQEKYASGCSALQNMIPSVQGPAIRRGGNYFVSEVADSTKRGWLVPFLFQNTNSYQLEFGDQIIRFYTNRGIVATNVGSGITAITQANPAQVTIAGHGLSTGNEVYLSGIVGMTQLNNDFYKVVVVDANNFTLQDSFGNTIDSTSFTAYISGGTAQTPYSIVSPYHIADLTDSNGNFRLSIKQSENVMYIAHPSYPLQVLSRIANTNWTMVAASMPNGPFQTVNTNKSQTAYVTLTSTTVSGAVNNGSGLIRLAVGSTTGLSTGCTVEVNSVAGTTEANGNWIVTVIDGTHIDLQGSAFVHAYSSGGNVIGQNGAAVTVTANASIFTSGMANELFYIETPPNNNLNQWEAGLSVTAGARYQSGVNTYIALNAGTTGNYTPVHTSGARYDGPSSSGVQWLYEDSGYGVIQFTTYNSGTSMTGTVVTMPNLLNNSASNQSYLWAHGLFSTANGYPDHVDIFRDRLQLTIGIQLAGSVSDDYLNFAPKIGGQVTADSSYVINLPTSSPVSWMAAQNSLLIGTGAEEISVGEIDVTQPLSPTNIAARKQSSYGSRPVAAVPIEYITMFLTQNGQQLQQFIYNWAINGYMAQEMEILSEHIPKGPDGNQGIVQLAWALMPDRILWGCTTDGRLVGFTFNRDQQVYSWHNHPVGGSNSNAPLAAQGFINATIESVSAIPSPDGTRIDLWMIANRTINNVNKRYIEYQTAYMSGTSPDIVNKAFYVDSGLTYSGASTSKIYGLRHLVGQTVSALGDGGVIKGANPLVVASDGTLTLPAGVSVEVAQIGLPCPYKLTTMRPEAGSQLGSAQGSLKKINHILFRLLNSLGGQYGPPDGTMDDIKYRTVEDDVSEAVPPFTGDTDRLSWPGGNDSDAFVTIEGSDPLPMTVVAVRWEMDTNEVTG